MGASGFAGAAQAATGLFGGGDQRAVTETKAISVQRTAHLIAVDIGHLQRMAAMRTKRLQQHALPRPLHQQQLMVVDLEATAIAVMQIDELFEGVEAHGGSLFKTLWTLSQNIRALAPAAHAVKRFSTGASTSL